MGGFESKKEVGGCSKRFLRAALFESFGRNDTSIASVYSKSYQMSEFKISSFYQRLPPQLCGTT
jgi:hypothetical protein